jgi:hypothetical protein
MYMNHVFCTDCGFKIEYSYSKPKFCSSCGTKTGAASLKKGSLVKKQPEEALAEDETLIDEIPDITSISVDVEQYNDNIFTFESLSEGRSSGGVRKRRGSKTIEDFIDDKKR